MCVEGKFSNDSALDRKSRRSIGRGRVLNGGARAVGLTQIVLNSNREVSSFGVFSGMGEFGR